MIRVVDIFHHITINSTVNHFGFSVRRRRLLFASRYRFFLLLFPRLRLAISELSMCVPAFQISRVENAGGQRQRYEYYGYSPVGCQYTYQVNAANVRHALRNVDASTVCWKRFADAAEAEIDLAYRLYQQQPITGVRSREDFELIMRTWRAEPYLLLHEAEVLGYMVVSGTDSVSELVVSDVSCVPALIKGWFAANGLKNMSFSVAAFDTALNRALAAFAEGYQVSNCTQARIVNLANVLRACLTLKMRAGALSDGEVILQMDDEAPVLARAKDGQITMQETDAAPDVHLPRLEMQQLLFASNRFAAPEVSCPVDWFPLPLFLYGADHF